MKFPTKKFSFAIVTTLSIILGSFSFCFALPEGESVEGAEPSSYGIDRSTPNVLNISTSLEKLIINFNTYNIAANETVNYIQPALNTATVLNRVIGTSLSNIFGALNGTGNIILINPNGINIGSTANINVASLIASTLNISSQDFLSGNYNFFKSGESAFLINQGNIVVRNGGYIALLSQAIENQGVIVANLGTVVLASGEKTTLALDDLNDISVVVDEAVKEEVLGPDGQKIDSTVKNSGTISANGGKVILTAKVLNKAFDYSINNTGIIQAKSLVSHNGVVELVAEGAPIYNIGRIEAGEVKVQVTNSDFINKGQIITDGSPELPNGGRVSIGANTVLQQGLISANAQETGIAGEIIIVSQDSTTLDTGSTTEAKALGWVGNGGKIRIDSTGGNTVVNKDAVIDVSSGAISGNAGSLEVGAFDQIGFFGVLNGRAPPGYNFADVTLKTNLPYDSSLLDVTSLFCSGVIIAQNISILSNQRVNISGILVANDTILVDSQGADYSGVINSETGIFNANGGDTSLSGNVVSDITVKDEVNIFVSGDYSVTGNLTIEADWDNPATPVNEEDGIGIFEQYANTKMSATGNITISGADVHIYNAFFGGLEANSFTATAKTGEIKVGHYTDHLGSDVGDGRIASSIGGMISGIFLATESNYTSQGSPGSVGSSTSNTLFVQGDTGTSLEPGAGTNQWIWLKFNLDPSSGPIPADAYIESGQIRVFAQHPNDSPLVGAYYSSNDNWSARTIPGIPGIPGICWNNQPSTDPSYTDAIHPVSGIWNSWNTTTGFQSDFVQGDYKITYVLKVADGTNQTVKFWSQNKNGKEPSLSLDYWRLGEGNISLIANGNGAVNTDIALGQLLTRGNVSLDSQQGAITDINGVVRNVMASELNAQAVKGIDLDTAVSRLTATNSGTTGDVIIDNDGNLEIYDAGVTNDANGGAVDITASTNLTVNAPVSSKGNITLNAVTGSITQNADGDITIYHTLVLGPPTNVHSTSHTVGVDEWSSDPSIDVSWNLPTQGAGYGAFTANAGGTYTMQPGSEISTNGGNASLTAVGAIYLTLINAGNGDVVVTGASVLDNDPGGSNDVDIIGHNIKVSPSNIALELSYPFNFSYVWDEVSNTAPMDITPDDFTAVLDGSGDWIFSTTSTDLADSNTGWYFHIATVSGSAQSPTEHLGPFYIGRIAQIVFITKPYDGALGNNPALTAGVVSGIITVETQNQFGVPVDVTTATTVNLSSDSSGIKLFYSDSGGTTVITFKVIPNGSHTASFYYSDTKAGNPIVTASSSPLTPGTQQETVNAANLDHFDWSPIASPKTAGELFSATITARDAYGNLTTKDIDGSTFTNDESVTFTTTAHGIGVYKPTYGGDDLTDGTTVNVGLTLGSFLTSDIALVKAGETSTISVSHTVTIDETDVTASGISNEITVVAAEASSLIVDVANETPTAGQASDVIVTLKDPYGNTADGYRGTVTFSSTDGDPYPAILPYGGSYTFTETDAGEHTFSVVDDDGVTFYTAGPQTLYGDDIDNELHGEDEVDVRPAEAYYMLFTVQPTDTTAGQNITPAVEVSLYDEFDNPVIWDNATSIDLTLNASGVGFTGTLPQTVSGGVATFSDLSITKADTGYVLTASSGELEDVDSDPFAIIADEANYMLFTAQPTDTTAGQTISAPTGVQVSLYDQYDNPVDWDNSTQIDLALNASDVGFTGTFPQTVSGGVATFADLSITKADTGYILTASSGELDDADSEPFAILAAAPSQLVVSGITDPIQSGSSSDVIVTVLDPYGNIVDWYIGTIHFTSTDLYPAILPGDHQFTGTGGDNGTNTFPDGVTLYTEGQQTVTATDIQSEVTGSGSQTVTVIGLPTPPPPPLGIFPNLQDPFEYMYPPLENMMGVMGVQATPIDIMSSDLLAHSTFYYHPLTPYDMTAYDQFILEEGAYEFIERTINIRGHDGLLPILEEIKKRKQAI